MTLLYILLREKVCLLDYVFMLFNTIKKNRELHALCMSTLLFYVIMKYLMNVHG